MDITYYNIPWHTLGSHSSLQLQSFLCMERGSCMVWRGIIFPVLAPKLNQDTTKTHQTWELGNSSPCSRNKMFLLSCLFIFIVYIEIGWSECLVRISHTDFYKGQRICVFPFIDLCLLHCLKHCDTKIVIRD